jgi:hypothetical protein
MPAALVYLPINTLIDPSGVQVFGETVTTSDLIIDLSGTLSAADLSAFLQYKENPANRDLSVVSCKAVADAEGVALVADLSGCVNSLAQCDLSGGAWWTGVSADPQYSNQAAAMYNYSSLAEVLLGQIAYDLFGHPLAKAGIANDTEILAYIKTNKPSEALVTSIVSASADNGLNVVFQQLVKQDPARFAVQDSSGGVAPGAPGSNPDPVNMPFQAGDHIRFEVTLNTYAVSSFSNSAGSADTGGYDVSKALFSTAAGATTHTYTVDVTLA